MTDHTEPMDTVELDISQPDVSLDNPELDVSQHNASDVPADTPEPKNPPPGAPDVHTDTPELNIPRLDNSSDLLGSLNSTESAATGNDKATQSDPAEAREGVDVVNTIELPQLQLTQQYIDLL
jgi:hypothetical protein